jgi:sugar fermentation stimulation protein A
LELPPLVTGRILKRYRRFLADVLLDDGRSVTAHCPNTGSMRTCWAPGAPAQLSHSDDPRRKLRWTLERVDMGRGWVGVHTGRVNAVVAEALAAGRVGGLQGYAVLRREVPLRLEGLPPGRLDVGLFAGEGADALIEVKNVTLLEGECLRFPDAVTARGRKHLDLLLAAREAGWRTVMVFALNRPEGRCFAPAWEVDAAYAQRLAEVAAAGVEVRALRIRHDPGAMVVAGEVPWRLEGRG